MKTEFTLKLYDDDSTRKKADFLNKLEIMFDDERNPLPPEWDYFVDGLPYGSVVKVIFEVLE